MIKLETKFNEIQITTSNLEEMKEMFLADRLLRTWTEDFVDEDTGEVVKIERNEVLLERGTFIDPDTLSSINFYLQSGDIEEVTVSNQKRQCRLSKNCASVWIVTVELNSKKKNIYLYANSVESAMDIVADFIEQKYYGTFKFIGLKELDYSNLISVSIDSEEEEKNDNYYKIEVEILFEEDDQSVNQNFILNAPDAEKAKLRIINFLMKQSERERSFDVTIISAKTIPCNDVINQDFSKAYLESKQ
ncbi:hypothetical protein [Tenacibaculum sp. 190524A02b]|uniref:hypothetical protein n=1 Tax=Tenacibaculum vairaonense TaxID=3137860 RepID=UPI0031FA844E